MVQKNDLQKAYTDPIFYDKLEVIKLNLSDDSSDVDSGIIRALDMLLSGVDREEKKKILKEDFNMTDSEIEQEVDEMCNLSEYYYEKGEEQGIEQGMVNSIKKMLKELSPSQIINMGFDKELVERVEKSI